MTRFTPLWLQAGTYPAGVDRRLIGALWPAAATSGMAVTASTGMVVNVAAGACAVPTANNTGSTLCASDATEQVTLAAAPATGTNRIDVVIVQPRGADLDGGANNDWILTTVTGAAAATPIAPAVPAGAAALAQIYVAGGSASVVAGNITDRRPGFLSLASTVAPAQATGSTSVVFSNVSVTGLVSVTFPAGRFTTPPKVMAICNTTSGIWVVVSSISAASFNVRGLSNTSVTATIQVDWFASAAV